MRLIESFKIAFSMYSSIPMPYADWNKQNMKYAICFFPLVGILIGLLQWFWSWISKTASIGVVLSAVVFTLIPFFITGGIHMDGFCDTVDALSSHQTTERKLEILKDSHTGAFAIMGCVVYFLLCFALWSELQFDTTVILILGVGYVLSRSLSGFSVVGFRCAKNSGLLASFSETAQKRNVKIAMGILIVICMTAMLLLDICLGFAAIVAAYLTFFYYRVMSYRQFGGTTGDLAGYFLQICEISMLGAIVIAQKC